MFDWWWKVENHPRRALAADIRDPQQNTSDAPYSPCVQPIPPPPPPPSGRSCDKDSGHPFGTLPEGWTTACDTQDGRIYYWHTPSGRTSWTHPLALETPSPNTLAPPPPQYGQQQQQQMATPPPFLGWNQGLYDGRGSGIFFEHPSHATRRPDSRECKSVMALFCCPLLGVMALYHSISVNRKWNQGRYSESVNHARQAPRYAWWAIAIGCCFWIYYFCFRPGSDFRWPDWDFHFD